MYLENPAAVRSATAARNTARKQSHFLKTTETRQQKEIYGSVENMCEYIRQPCGRPRWHKASIFSLVQDELKAAGIPDSRKSKSRKAVELQRELTRDDATSDRMDLHMKCDRVAVGSKWFR